MILTVGEVIDSYILSYIFRVGLLYTFKVDPKNANNQARHTQQ